MIILGIDQLKMSSNKPNFMVDFLKKNHWSQNYLKFFPGYIAPKKVIFWTELIPSPAGPDAIGFAGLPKLVTSVSSLQFPTVPVQ